MGEDGAQPRHSFHVTEFVTGLYRALQTREVAVLAATVRKMADEDFDCRLRDIFSRGFGSCSVKESCTTSSRNS